MSDISKIAAVSAIILLTSVQSQAEAFGPFNYRCFDSSQIAGCLDGQQSLFSNLSFAYFYLEDFEDALFDVPGITPDHGGIIQTNNAFQDSVDEDDGVIDGVNLPSNKTYGVQAGAPTIVLSFNADQLGGRFPTHVGLALVNNFNEFVFRAFDSAGAQVDEVAGSTNFVANGSALDDNFTGISHASGIASVSISGGGGGMELDHIQYGFACIPTADLDLDGVADAADNCLFEPNPSQTDADGDGFGNACDVDLNNDGVANAADLGLFRDVFFTNDASADFNSDGIVNASDLGVLRRLFFASPGPVCSAASR